MCEADAYILNEGREELLLEKVDKLTPQEGDQLLLENIFGQKKFIQAKIHHLALVDHKIILEQVIGNK
ncbi:MAG: CooT family nickel-binding protein [Clostridiales bacterium]|jgi:predicted RNA-binding protein|nr:CooT family nickel-binding protein [Clostridiales bacterium]MDR2713684.1 CooT family nickel-binding protein [Clostridiales bacterium]